MSPPLHKPFPPTMLLGLGQHVVKLKDGRCFADTSNIIWLSKVAPLSCAVATLCLRHFRTNLAKERGAPSAHFCVQPEEPLVSCCSNSGFGNGATPGLDGAFNVIHDTCVACLLAGWLHSRERSVVIEN